MTTQATVMKKSSSMSSLRSQTSAYDSCSNLSALIESEAGEGACPKTFLRQMSSAFFADEEEIVFENVDEERLQRALADAGEYAYGIAAVEVWVWDESTGWLSRPREGSWWTNPALDMQENTALRRLADDLPEKTMPGVDLAGILFAESPLCATPQAAGSYETSPKEPQPVTKEGQSLHVSGSKKVDISLRSLSKSFDSRRKPFFSKDDSRSESKHEPNANSKGKTENHHQAIQFRDIYSLLLDPDTPKTSRLTLIVQAGFKQAAAVPFQFGWHEGIVVYYTHCDANDVHLTSIPNQVYMVHAADIIGAVLGSADARKAAQALKRMATMPEEEIAPFDKHEVPQKEDKDERPDMFTNVVVAANRWWIKCHGGNLQPPPSMPAVQALWTFLGVGSALLLILSFNHLIDWVSNGDYHILLGPVGALMTLQYGLTQAPASQPRNILFGQIIAGLATMPITYIPMPALLKQAIAPALAISLMTRLGITHPPAGGASIVLASGTKSWIHYLLIVLASGLSLLPAIVINNLNQKRQYPTYWGFLYGLPTCLTKKVSKGQQE